MLPIHIREKHESDLHSAGSGPLGKRRNELRGELTQLDAIVGLRSPHPSGLDVTEQRILHLQSAAPDLIYRNRGNVPYVDDSVWQEYVAEREAKRPALETELAQVNERIRERAGDTDGLLNFYVEKLL